MNRLWIAALLFLASPVLRAEEPAIFLKTAATPTDVRIGDRIRLDITITYAGAEPAANDLGQTAGDFEILSVTSTDPKPAKENRRTLTRTLELVTFSTGALSIPPLPIHFRKADGTVLEAMTNEVPVNVKSELEAQGDIGGLKPLKGLYNVRSWWWLWLLAGGALAAGLWLLWRKGARRGDGEEERREPLLSPEDEAAQALQSLEATPLSEETVRDYYFSLSSILRRYLERRYGIAALEMTTSELNAALRKLDIPVSASLICREFLDNGDLVKFAKILPSLEEAAGDVGRVKSIIDITTPRPVPTEVTSPPEEAPL